MDVKGIIILIVCCFILLDMLTGMIKAFKEKEYNSSVMREGLFHKTGSIILIVLGLLIDHAQVYLDIGFNIPIAIGVCSYIIIMEIGSIIENVGKINPKIVPAKLREHFTKLNQKEGNA